MRATKRLGKTLLWVSILCLAAIAFIHLWNQNHASDTAEFFAQTLGDDEEATRQRISARHSHDSASLFKALAVVSGVVFLIGAILTSVGGDLGDANKKAD